MPVPTELQNHLELKFNHDEVMLDYKIRLDIYNASDKDKKPPYRCLYMYNDQYFIELPENSNLGITSIPNKNTAITNGKLILPNAKTTGQNPIKDTLYAWEISEETYKNLTIGKNKKLKPTGSIANIFDKFHDLIYNRNNNVSFGKNNGTDESLYFKKKINQHRFYLQDEIELDILRKKDDFQTEWNRTAKSIGLMDSIWVYLGALLTLIPEEDMKFGWDGYFIDATQFTFNQAAGIFLANLIFPAALALGSAYTNYYAQIDAFKEKYGCEPSQDVKNEIWRQSKQLGYKVFFAVGGWTVGYEVVAPMLCALDPTGGTQSAIILSALVIGLTAATFLCFSAIHFMAKDAQHAAKEKGDNMSYGAALFHVLENNKLDLLKLFVIGTIAGAAWHVINTLMPTPSGELTNIGADILGYFLKGTTTYFAVTSIFMMLKPKTSAEERKNTGWFNAYSPVAVVDTKAVHKELEKIEREEIYQGAAFSVTRNA